MNLEPYLAKNKGVIEHIIAYVSRDLKGSKKNCRNYSTFKLELLALKWGVTENFKAYLMFAKFQVITNHNPLCYLEMANLGGVQQHWATQLVEFNFKVCYKPGRQNINSNVLCWISWVVEPEDDDTGKDLIQLSSDEVHACLWLGKEEEGNEPNVQVSKQAEIKKGVNGYSWSAVEEQQRKDPCIVPVYDVVYKNGRLVPSSFRTMGPNDCNSAGVLIRPGNRVLLRSHKF